MNGRTCFIFCVFILIFGSLGLGFLTGIIISDVRAYVHMNDIKKKEASADIIAVTKSVKIFK